MRLADWFDELDRSAAGNAALLAAMRAERVVFDPGNEDDLDDLREDAERIARGMDSPQHPPAMLWSGIPAPPPADEVTCDYHLVVSVGGTKTEFAMLRLERGELVGLDLQSGREVSGAEEIERLKDDLRMATPVHGPECPDGLEMVRQIVAHMSDHLRPHRDTALARCPGVLLSFGFATRTVRTGPRLLGGLAAIVTRMTKDQQPFTEDLRGRNIGELFSESFGEQLGWTPAVAVANDTVMALAYFLGPRWRPRFHRVGLFINGTGTNFAIAEPYAVRADGFVSAPGEEYRPDRLCHGRDLRAGETAVDFFVNYESGGIELIATRTRFDLSEEYQIERNALAGGNAFGQQLRELTRELVSPELWDRLRDGWSRTGASEAPGGPEVGRLSESDGSVAAVSAILGGIELEPGEAAALRLIARAIVGRSALHAALVLAAITRRIGYGRGDSGRPDLVAVEGSVWKNAGYIDLVRAWWRTITGEKLEVEFAHEPSFNASLPGPLYLAALCG